MLVDFMIVGAQKCGTSTLYRILDRHPDLQGSSPKEPDFFSTCDDWRAELPRYHRCFREHDGLRCFEASTSYTFYPARNLAIWDDIYAYNPEMRFIYVVRDPIDRIVSSYMHSYERGYENRSLDEAVRRGRFYVDVTRYATQIRPYIRRFGRDRVLIVFFEDLVERTEQVVEEVAAFLDVSPDGFERAASTHANRSVGGHKIHHRYDPVSGVMKHLRVHAPPVWRALRPAWDAFTRRTSRGFETRPEMPESVRRVVLDLLESDIAELERLTGRDLSRWRRSEE